MINAEQGFMDGLSAPVRNISARVELFEGSTLVNAYNHIDNLKSFSINRAPEANKFFGFGVCQKLNVKLIDIDGNVDVSTTNELNVALDVGSGYLSPFPKFKVTEVHRDEVKKELSVTAYDALYNTATHYVSELELPESYTLLEFATACAQFIGLPLRLENVPEDDFLFGLFYEIGANLDGSETIRQVLDAIAEATQTIYFINYDNCLTFKRLDMNGEAVFELTKDKYASLSSKTNRRLSTIGSVTELGDNVSISTNEIGTTQYVRNNAFWELREDMAAVLEAALANVGGLTINQFDCDWRGNFLVEIGDKLAITNKDGEVVHSYLLNDKFSFDGGLAQSSQWDYDDTGVETESNPASLGDALNNTFAKVDKVNKQIQNVASETQGNSELIGSLQVQTNNITASVQRVEKMTNEAIEDINGELESIKKSVEATITDEHISFLIKQELSGGTTIDKVETSSGFIFDENGLTVSKSDSEISTVITEDGMTVYKGSQAVLEANNKGVNAQNLHATTYLIIGTNSRFEDYGNRTGCFWIGS